MHVLARVLIYGAGWFLTSTVLFGVSDWARPRETVGNKSVSLLLSTWLWAIIIGIIYW